MRTNEGILVDMIEEKEMDYEPNPTAQEVLEAHYSTVARLRGELASARQEVAELRQELETYATDHEETLARHETELARLRAEFELLRDALFPVEHVLVTGEPWEPWAYDEYPAEPDDPYVDAPEPVEEVG